MTDTPAQFYREAVHNGGLRYAAVAQTASDFPSYLLLAYQQLCTHLQEALLNGAPETDVHFIRRDIAYLAVGLLAYGHHDMVEPILAGLPRVPEGSLTKKIYHLLANSLTALLPLPPTLHPLYHPEHARAWYQTHHAVLQWDEVAGKYTL